MKFIKGTFSHSSMGRSTNGYDGLAIHCPTVSSEYSDSGQIPSLFTSSKTVANGVARTLKNTHIKWRLLDQAMILFNYVPFQNGNFS